jgi:hypothetical protein
MRTAPGRYPDIPLTAAIPGSVPGAVFDGSLSLCMGKTVYATAIPYLKSLLFLVDIAYSLVDRFMPLFFLKKHEATYQKPNPKTSTEKSRFKKSSGQHAQAKTNEPYPAKLISSKHKNTSCKNLCRR